MQTNFLFYFLNLKMKGKNTLNWRREKANGKKKIFFF